MKRKFTLWLLVLLFVIPPYVLQAQDDGLTFWTFEYGDSVDPFFEDYLAEWNASHELQVTREEYPNPQYGNEVLPSAFATGTAPDVFFISPGTWRRYAEGGLALPLEDCIPQYLKDDIRPQSWDAVTLDGHIYSIPFEMEPVVLWYNKTMLEEAGVAVPTNWDELLAAAEALTTDDRYGIFVPVTPGTFENFVFYPFLWMAGGDIVNEDFTASVANSPETAQALDLWGTLVREGYAPNTSGSGDAVDDRFPNGQVAMFVSGYWVNGWLTRTYPEFIEHLGVAPIPAPAGHDPATVYGGWTVMVNAETEHPEEACEFAVNMFGAEDPARAIAWTTQYNTKLSPRRSAIEANAEFYQNFPHDVFANEIFPTARAEPAYAPEITTAIYETIQEVLYNNVSGADAAASLAGKVDTYLASR